jgi:5-methylcytosine-specific restriction protein A
MPNKPPTHRPPRLPTPDRRPSAASRGYGPAWRAARAAYLREHPLCVECERAGLTTAATVVDHRIPHKGDAALFWDPRNWQSLCKPCHDRLTARHDGGFGHPVTPKPAGPPAPDP